MSFKIAINLKYQFKIFAHIFMYVHIYIYIYIIIKLKFLIILSILIKKFIIKTTSYNHSLSIIIWSDTSLRI